MLVGSVLRAPAPLRRANVRGARPCPLPLALPLPARPQGAERCPAFGPGFFVRGARPSPPPRAPLPLYVSVWCCVCVYRGLGWYQPWWVCRGLVGGGVRGPSVFLRPPRFGADAGCRPMCPAPRPRPPSACALGRCAPRLPVLGSLCSLRFKRACVGRSVPFRLALARCGHSLAHFEARFCHFYMTKP